MRRSGDIFKKVAYFFYQVGVVIIMFVSSCSGGEGQRTGNGEVSNSGNTTFEHGAITRGDSTVKTMSLVFTGDQFAEGGWHILEVLDRSGIKGSFFFTGNFYRNPEFSDLIIAIKGSGHYLGAHSDKHLLYCDWNNRDSLLISKEEFEKDIEGNLREMARFDIQRKSAPIFLPPYEWYNDSISVWSSANGLLLVNYTPGTLSHADYTVPGRVGYRGSREIIESIKGYSDRNPSGLNGYILLTHIGAGPDRDDKFYLYLDELITWLKAGDYTICRVDSLPGIK